MRQLETAEAGEHEIFYLRRERNVGFPANANGAFALAAPADVVLLNSDCEVGADWLRGSAMPPIATAGWPRPRR